MDSERWNLIESIFQSVVDVPAGEREAALKTACAGDAELLLQVRAMIAADEKPHSILQGVAADALAIAEPEDWKGQPIGVYRVIHPIGEGGMGVVLLAERADGQFQQQVAIKLIKRGMDSDEIVKRFQRERQILARLQHPNIAMLLGGGVVEDGRPYFIMEYVNGTAIDIYCERQNLTVDQRLRLFLQVCETVAFAQRNLVVHRDLKPSNILVSNAGEVKLLDFGIAKVLNSDSDPQNYQALTRTGMRIMTPEYASPEQLVGDPVSTASDVYSLGVILYQLLTGDTPYQSANLRPAPLVDIATFPDPEKPSQRILRTEPSEPDRARVHPSPDKTNSQRRGDSRQRARRLAGDLDNICLKALRREPERRYHSAEQLHDDIKRHLAGMPVTARADSFSYRASKFIRRNRRNVVAAGLIFCAMLTMITYYTFQLSEERDRARIEARRAMEVSNFLVGIFSISDPSSSKGRSVSARELLDSGAVRLSSGLADFPETQASMMQLLGSIYYNLAQYDEARALTLKALEIRSALRHEPGSDAAISLLTLGMIEYSRGIYDSAEIRYRQALTIQQGLVGDQDSTVAEIQNDLGQVLRHQGKIAEAEQYIRKALATRRRLFGDRHADVAHSLTHLGRLLWTKRSFAEAEPLLREALATYTEVRGIYHLETVAATGALGSLMIEMNRLDEAESLYVRAAGVLERLVGKKHAHYAGISTSLAEIAFRKGEYARADSLYWEVWRIFKETFPETHPNLASPPAGIGRDFLATNQPESARVYLESALKMRRLTLGDEHWQTGMSMMALGNCFRALGRFDDAEPLLSDGYSLLLNQFGSRDDRTRQAIQALVDTYRNWGKTEKAEEFERLLTN